MGDNDGETTEEAKHKSYKSLTLDHLVWPQWMVSLEEQGAFQLPNPLPDRALEELQNINVGMTRMKLEEYLRPEGGIHTRTQRCYVTLACEYVHVMLEFDPSTPPELDDWKHWLSDRVTSISEPYLDFYFTG